MLVEGKDEEMRERMEIARWICFQIYLQNPYIKPPKHQTVQTYIPFSWEKMSEEEANSIKDNCRVTEEEQAELNRVLNAVYGKSHEDS